MQQGQCISRGLSRRFLRYGCGESVVVPADSRFRPYTSRFVQAPGDLDCGGDSQFPFQGPVPMPLATRCARQSPVVLSNVFRNLYSWGRHTRQYLALVRRRVYEHPSGQSSFLAGDPPGGQALMRKY